LKYASYFADAFFVEHFYKYIPVKSPVINKNQC